MTATITLPYVTLKDVVTTIKKASVPKKGSVMDSPLAYACIRPMDGTVAILTTDGHRLHQYDLTPYVTGQLDKDVLIPPEHLMLMLEGAKTGKTSTVISIYDDLVGLGNGKTYVRVAHTDMQYPRTNALWPTFPADTPTYTFNRKNLLVALREAKKAWHPKTRIIQADFTFEGVSIIPRFKDIPLPEPHGMPVFFDGQYLIDTLNALSEGTVTAKGRTASTSWVFSDESPAKCLLMPVLVK